MLTVAGVRLSDMGPTRFFTLGDVELTRGDFCIVDFDGEEATGEVIAVESRHSHCQCDHAPYPSVQRKASQQDMERWKGLKEREREALIACKEKAREHKLAMSISSARIHEKQNKITFNFTAEKRVDFRELVRDLAATLRSRIELWQVGVRDEARQMDGCGVCGRRLCCSGWLAEFRAITIRMAKDQEIALSPSKLSGCCGRLMCCLEYEQKQYKEMAAEAPAVGSMVRTQDVYGEVLERNLLAEWMAVRDESGEVYQIFMREVTETTPTDRSRRGGKKRNSSRSRGEREAEPEDRQNLSAETTLYLTRGGTPSRPPAAREREEEPKQVSDIYAYDGISEETTPANSDTPTETRLEEKRTRRRGDEKKKDDSRSRDGRSRRGGRRRKPSRDSKDGDESKSKESSGEGKRSSRSRRRRGGRGRSKAAKGGENTGADKSNSKPKQQGSSDGASSKSPSSSSRRKNRRRWRGSKRGSASDSTPKSD